MFQHPDVRRQFLQSALFEIVCVLLMLGVYALLGRFSRAVLLGALLGCFLAILNFLLLNLAVLRAAERAEQDGEAAKATLSVRASAVYRLLGMALVLILALRSGLCDPLASLLPLAFMQLSFNFLELFRKAGEKSCK